LGKAAKAITIIGLIIVVLAVIYFIDEMPDQEIIREKISESADEMSKTVKSPIPEAPKMQHGCDPSYPTVCIPVYPPDLDCDEIEFSNFKVSGTDPHGFDSDKDGIGCE